MEAGEVPSAASSNFLLSSSAALARDDLVAFLLAFACAVKALDSPSILQPSTVIFTLSDQSDRHGTVMCSLLTRPSNKVTGRPREDRSAGLMNRSVKVNEPDQIERFKWERERSMNCPSSERKMRKTTVSSIVLARQRGDEEGGSLGLEGFVVEVGKLANPCN